MSETSRIEIHGYAGGASEYGLWSWLMTCEDFEDDGDITDTNYFTFWREDLTKRLAKSLLEAHSGQCNYCPYTMSHGDCEGNACGCSQAGFGCYCDDCKLARTIMEHE